MIKNKNKIAAFFLMVTALLFFSGCGEPKQAQPQYKLTLEVWGFDDGDVLVEAFANYKKLYPAIKEINYKKQTINAVSYKEELLDALAAGKGPDIFLIHNAWLPTFKDKIIEAPADVISEQRVKNNFVDVVLADFVEGGKIFALPLSVDSLALYYNKDLLNEAGITGPPADWDSFVSDARKMTKIDNTGQIIQSGASLGTAYNINRATDILGALMIQRGAQMNSEKKYQATFNMSVSTKSGDMGTVYPGQEALEFYTNFAKTSSAAYSWNSNMHYSLDAFSEGKLAMMLNYSWQREAIANKSPKLNFDVAPLPQFSGGYPLANYANYWGFSVARNNPASTSPQSGKSKSVPVSNDIRIKEAWKLIAYLTTKPELSSGIKPAGAAKDADPNYDPAKKYMEKTAKPAGRRDLIEVQKNDTKVGVFAQQNLIAKSWYQPDALAVEAIMAEMIEQVVGGQLSIGDSISSAANKITRLGTGG